MLVHAPPVPLFTVHHMFLHMFDSFRISFNQFWIACEYQHQPTHNQDSFLSLDKLLNSNPHSLTVPTLQQQDAQPSWSWANMTIWHLMTWVFTGSHWKSAGEVTQLVHDVLQAPEFSLKKLTGFDSHTEAHRLDGAQKTICMDSGQDKWQCKSVDIVIPTRENNQAENEKTFTIKGFYHWLFLDVIHAVFSEALSKSFHLTPFKKVDFLDEDKRISFHTFLKVLEVAIHWWRATCVQWTLYVRQMDQGSGWDSEAKKNGWLQTGVGQGRDYAVVWLYAFGQVWSCICMTDLPLLWKFV